MKRLDELNSVVYMRIFFLKVERVPKMRFFLLKMFKKYTKNVVHSNLKSDFPANLTL